MDRKPLVERNFWLSKELVDIVSEYKKKFRDLFAFIENSARQSKNSIFERFRWKASEIFDVASDLSNIRLVQAYLWVIKHGKINLKFRPISSEIISQSKTHEICTDIKNHLQAVNFFHGETDKEILSYDPNFLIR